LKGESERERERERERGREGARAIEGADKSPYLAARFLPPGFHYRAGDFEMISELAIATQI
jgi:hypothetical protein